MVVTGCFVPAILVIPTPTARAFTAGAAVTGAASLLAFGVVQFTGTAGTLMGELAEQWTAQEFRKMRPRGWRLINHLMLRKGDIDHVVLGPGGVIVAESKWASSWESDLLSDFRLPGAVAQVRRNAADVRLVLRPRVDAPVEAALVLWGPGLRDLPPHLQNFEHEGVRVVTAPVVTEWIERDRDPVLEPQQVEAAWNVLDGYVRRREAVTPPDTPPSLYETVRDVGLVIAAFVAGAAGAAVVWPLRHWSLYAGLAIAAAAALFWVRRFRPLRAVATGLLLGVEFVAVVLLSLTALGPLYG
jgi:hypothetical protein